MVTLAVLPGMLRISLVVANLANPGNSSRAINLLVSQRGIVGLVLGGRGMRRRHGLGEGRTVSLDRVTLTSRRLGLTRPDRLIKTDGTIIPEECKSAS